MLAEAASAAGGVTLDVSAVSAPAIVVGADAAGSPGRAVRPPGNDIWARVRLHVFYTERLNRPTNTLISVTTYWFSVTTY